MVVRAGLCIRQNPHLKECLEVHLKVKPVYLGEHYHAERTVTSTQMLNWILLEAKGWTDSAWKDHPCKEFFEKRPSGEGYHKRAGFMLSVDHVIPASWGGLDHPRNYMLMAKSLNSSYADRNLAEKLALLRRGQQVLVRAFATTAKREAKPLIDKWLKDKLESRSTTKSTVEFIQPTGGGV